MAVATNLGTGGSVLDAQFGSSPTSNTNEPLLLGHTGTNYLYLPGVAGNFASTPDANALDITGDIELVVRVSMDDWTPAFTQLMSKATGNSGYGLYLNTNGTVGITWGDGAGFPGVSSSVAPSINDGSALWIKATLDVNNGAGGKDAKFWTAPDQSTEPTSWTQLGTTVTQAGTTSIAAGSGQLCFGVNSAANSGFAAAKFYRAIVRDGIGGTTVFDADFTQGITSGAQTTFTATTGQTVTINRSTAGRKSVAVVRPVWLLGTDDFFEVADNALLDFDAGDSFTVVAVVRQWATPGSSSRIVDKANTTDSGWSLQNQGTNAAVWASIDDGPNQASRNGLSTYTLGTARVSGLVVDRSAQTLASFTNGTLSATTSTASVASVANALPMRVGSNAAGAGGAFADMELYAVAVFRRALTAGELSTIAAYYGAV